MTATVTTFGRGNLAIQQEKWQVPIRAAKCLLNIFKGRGELGPGKYWESTFAKPARRAVRARSDHVTIYTAGFSTGQFANVLREAGCEIQALEDES